jgi:hypothetical protein
MRLGTRKSRAPSGLEAVRIGVEYSVKPLFHAAAHVRDDLRARHDVGVQRLAAQVEEAIAQADILGIFLLAGDRHRQFFGRRAPWRPWRRLRSRRSQVGIDGRFVAGLHHAVDGHHAFDAAGFEEGERGAVAVGHDLGDAVVVAQVDEQHAAMIALAMDPAREADILADMLAREGAAGVGTIRVHRNSFPIGLQ